MRTLQLKAIRGPNVYHNLPVLIMTVDLEEWAERPSNTIEGFTERLLKRLPGLEEHHCSPGRPGGFHQRLSDGTYMGHIIEHVALELSGLAGIGVTYGKTLGNGETSVYDIVVRYKQEEGMRACLLSAFQLVEAELLAGEFDLEQNLAEIKRIIEAHKMGPSAQAIFDAAEKRGIPCVRVGDDSLLRLGYGARTHFVQTAVTDRTSVIAVELAQDKHLTKKVLNDVGIPVPDGQVVNEERELATALRNLKRPFAVKPLDGHHGQGVSLNLNDPADIIKAFRLAKRFSKSVLVEEMCFGFDYRALVVGGKLVAAAERTPPFVVGDGRRKLSELIASLNEHPLRANGHGGMLTRIEPDEQMLDTLKKQGLTLSSELERGRKAWLRECANLSGGGTAEDVTDRVHPEVRVLCERIARVIGLDICGIDLIHPDISKPVNHGLRVIEVNAGPGLRMHLQPAVGKPRDVGGAIIDLLYPNPEEARIPIVGITGTNGKTSTARMLAKIFSGIPGSCVGLTSTDGIWIGSEQIESGDMAGPVSAMKVLSDPKVTHAVLEVARGGLVRKGLGYDWSDVGIITNIRPDHIGQDGIEDLEDLVRIKSIIAERVREGGTLVLNADDEESLKLATHPRVLKIRRNLLLYSLDPRNRALIAHVAAKRDACWLENGYVYASVNGAILRMGLADSYPVTMEGLARFQISNLLAAVGAALSQGVKPIMINEALRSFSPVRENRGRANLFKIHGAYVLLDYGHNPDAIAAVGQMLASHSDSKLTAILGLPGDRADTLLEESGHAVARYFDRVFLRDDHDLRGRARGEVPKLLHRLLRERHPETIAEIQLEEKHAVERAVLSVMPNEVIVVFYEDFEGVMEALKQFDPEPVDRIPRLPRRAPVECTMSG